jgi:guanylate kinase
LGHSFGRLTSEFELNRKSNMVKKEVYTGMVSREDQAIEVHRARLDQLQVRWDLELKKVAATFAIDPTLDIADTMKELETLTCSEWLIQKEKDRDTGIVLGLAGPGASGKGTLGEYATINHGFGKVINTTTRDKRHYEVDGIDYHFVDPEEYQRRLDAGTLLGANDKPGRGRYGIGKDDLEAGIAKGGCLVEESPINLLKALEGMAAETTTVLMYILPPYPIMDTCARRLYGRSAKAEEDRILTIEDVESTLGDRQIDEFSALNSRADYPNVRVVFLINDELMDSQKKVDSLFS